MYVLCIFKKGHSSVIVLAMAFVLVGLSKGDAHSRSQLLRHWADDPRSGHPLRLLLSCFCRSREGKV